MDEYKVNVGVNTKDADKDLDALESKLNKLKNDKHTIKVDTDSGTGKDTEKVNQALNKTTTSAKNASQAIKTSNSSLKSFTSSGAKIAGVYQAFNVLSKSAREAVSSVKEIDTAIVDLQNATGYGYQNVRQMVQGYNQMGQSLGATTTEITSGASDWLRQGKSIQDTNKLVKDSMVLSKVANISSADSTKYLTAGMKGYKLSTEQALDVVDKLTSVDLVSATDAGGLAEAMSRTANAANNAGVGMDKLLGYLATTGEVTQRSMSSIGESFKTIFARLESIKAGNLEFIDDAGQIESLSNVEDALGAIGVKLRDSDNEFRNSGDVLDELASKWKSLSSVQQSGATQAIAGVRQSENFKALMNNYADAQKYAEVAADSSGTAMSKFDNNYLPSIEAKMKSLKATFEGLATGLIDRDMFAGFIDGATTITEFADKTNILKGTLAGLGTGVALKGITSIAGGFVEAAGKMERFNDALKLVKVGDIGTDEVDKLTTLTDGLSQSQLKAVMSSSALSAEQRMTILTSQGMSGAEASAAISSMGLSAAQQTTSTSTISLTSSLKGLWATLMANPLVMVAMAVTAGVSVWQSYKQSIEDAANAADKSSQKFKENLSSLNDQKTKVAELKQSLVSGHLSPDETYQAKSQLLGIQKELISTYGKQASGIDLVNGKLETELGLMNKLSTSQANKSLNENKDAFERAKKQMTKERSYQLGSIAPDGLKETGYQKASQKIRELAKKFESQGIHLDDGNYSTSITFRGDASQAEQVMNNFATEVRKLTDDSKDENFHDALDNILTASSESLSKNKKVLDDYQERYNDYLEMDLFGKGTRKGKPAGVFNDYVKAVDDYNNAIVNIDDADGLKNAKDNFNNIGTEVDNVLKKYPEYTPIFKTVEEQLNKTAIAGKDFNDALTGEGTSKKQKEIKELADTLKSQNLSDIDFQNGFQHKDDTINAIIDKAKQLGVIADTSDESIHALTNSLIEAGIISGEVVENLTVAAKSFEDAKNNTNDLSQSLGNAYGMVADQTTGKSISLNDFNDKSVKDYTSALEYNNGALQINAKKVKELTKAKVDEQIVQNDSAKLELQSQYLKNAGTIEDYSNALKGAKETVLDGKKITQDMLSSLQTSNNSIANQCDQLDILSASLREATGEYQAWLDAQSGAESGDMFRNALEAQQAIRDVVDSDSDSYDKVGTKKYKAAVDFIIPDSVDNEDDVAVQHYLDSIGYAFTKNEEGAIDGLNLQGFLDTAAKQGLMEVDGDNYQVKGQQTMDSFAKGMNMSLPLVRAIFGELEEYGGEFSWADEAVSTLGDLGIKANKAADAIRGVAGNENMQIQLDVSDLDNTTDKISALDNTITQMEEYKQVHVDASSVEQANSIIQYCVAQEQQLTQPAIMTVDASQVEGEMGQVISKLQELKSTTNDKEIQASVGADTSQADAKINGLVDEIQQMNPDIMAKLNIDTSSADTIISSLGAQTPELMAKCNLDSSAVDNYVAPPKDATVTYGVDHSAVDAYDPSNLKRTVTYTVTTKGTPPSGDGSANGTAHAHGTTHAPHIKGSGFNDGNWGLDKSETALTGELGQELVVRDGRFFTIGDHGAEFVSLKKGDIVFNHLQTQALLSKGYVTGRGNLVGSSSFANGTALVTGGIKKRNAKKVSASKKKTTKKKTTPKKTTSSKKSSSSKSSSSNAKKSTPKSGSSKSSSSSQKDFEDKIDWIEVNLQRLGEAIDEFVNMADNYYSGYISQNKMLDQAIAKTKESIANHESGYNYYMQQANAVGISEDWKNKVRNGQINIDTIKDEDLSKKVGEFKELYEKAIEVRKEIIELNAQIQKLNLQKLDNVEESFDAFTNTAKQIHDGFNALNELLESQGKRTSWTNTLEMLGQKGSAETSLRGEVEQLRTLENQMLANGSMKKWSKEYYELETRIIGVQQRLYETQAEEYKLREEMRKIQWRPFEDAIEKIDALNDELDDTLDLIKDLDAFSKESGMMNSNGLAQLGLLTQSLGNARQAVENYNIAFEALNTELQNGNINQDQYNTQLQDLKERQRDAVSDVKKYRDAIVDLIKDGIEAETDAMSKLVDKQKDNLRAQKDADDYARTMRDKTKEINKIQAQIAALEGDDSASAKSKVRDLKNQLKEAQQDLEDTQKDHKYDELNKGYDDAMDKFKETQDKEVDLLNSSLEEQTKAIQDMLNSAKNQYATTYDELEELAATYGFHLSEDLANPWKTAANAVDAYNKAVGNVTANGIPATGKVPGLNGGTNNVTYAENNPSAPDNNVKANQQANANKGLVSGGSGLLKSGSRGQAVTNLQNALNGLGYNAGKADGIFGNNTKNALIRFQKDSGISADGIVGNNTRSKFAARGYRMGGVTKKEWAFMDEVGLGSEFVITPNGVMGQFNSGNTIFDPEQTNFLYNVSKNHTLNPSMPDMSQAYASFAARSPSFGRPEVNVNIKNIEGNFDESILPQFKKIAAGEYDRKMARWERDRRNDARELGHR